MVLAYTANTVDYASEARRGDAAWASCAAYCSAFEAGFAVAGDTAEARRTGVYRDERAWQAEWLTRRLGLETEL